MKKRGIKNKYKRAAFEMSITTVVVLVIAMVMLALGLVLVKKIFGGATGSVDTINTQIKSKIINMFGSEGTEIIVKLGTQNSARVKQGTQNFGFAFGIAPTDVSDLSKCTYNITKSKGDCKGDVLKWFKYGTTGLRFDEISATSAFALVKLDIPEYQQPCSQKFYIIATCPGGWKRQTYFNIDVVKKGFF